MKTLYNWSDSGQTSTDFQHAYSGLIKAQNKLTKEAESISLMKNISDETKYQLILKIEDMKRDLRFFENYDYSDEINEEEF